MNIGSLNHRIRLESPTRVADGMGAFTTTWTDEGTYWAGIWPTSASERVMSAQPTMTISHRIRIRYHDTIKASWRVKFGLRYFTIVSIINPNEQNRLLDLMCMEAET